MTTEWKLVPVEPTDEMKMAARNAPLPMVMLDSMSARQDLMAVAAYKAMLTAAPVPPAGGEVEVLGYRYHHPDCKDFSPVMTNDKATDEERGDWAETALVDRAHVTRLQVDLYQMTTFRDNAESHMRRIRAECTAVEKERDRLQSELTKAREALEGMVEYFPEGHSDGECFTVERAKAVLAHQSAPAAKGESDE